MDPYAPPYSPLAYAPPNNPYSHQQFFYPQEGLVQRDDIQYDSSVHSYWKDRTVPAPGFRSPRTLRPTLENNRIVIKDPKKSPETSKKQLLPPRSYGKPNGTQPQISEVKEGEKSPELAPATKQLTVSTRSYLFGTIDLKYP